MTTPTVRLKFLGAYVRQFREAAGMSPAEVAKLLDPRRPPVTKVSKVETGNHGLTYSEARLLGDEFRRRAPDDVDIDLLLSLAGNRAQRGRWSDHRGSVPLRQRMYLDFEEDANALCIHSTEIVPGLLQTEDYMRAELANSPRVIAGDTDKIVAVRLERQRLVLDRDVPPDLHVVMSESALWRIYGGNAVMRAQMEHLVALTQRSNLRIQVIPRLADVSSVVFPFTMLWIPAPRAVDPPLEVIYNELLHDASYADDAPTVADYHNMWGHLTSGALDREGSRRLILRYAQDYS